jgi:hypothetical protein
LSAGIVPAGGAVVVAAACACKSSDAVDSWIESLLLPALVFVRALALRAASCATCCAALLCDESARGDPPGWEFTGLMAIASILTILRFEGARQSASGIGQHDLVSGFRRLQDGLPYPAYYAPALSSASVAGAIRRRGLHAQRTFQR